MKYISYENVFPQFLLTFAVIFFVVIQQGSCMRCFYCKSSRDGPCGNPSTTDGVGIDNCPFSDDKCFRYDFKVKGGKDNERVVERGCAPQSARICSFVPSETEGLDYECDFCHTELCNNGTHIKVLDNNRGNGGDSSTASIFALSAFIFTRFS